MTTLTEAAAGAKTLTERIEAAINRITEGRAPMRIPADQTDPDLVLVDCRDRIAELEAFGAKVNAIRNSIIGMQGFNFSEHAYPLVAALDAAGFEGEDYPAARANLGTLIEQRDAAVAEVEKYRADFAKDQAELASMRNQLAACHLRAQTAELANVELRRHVEALAKHIGDLHHVTEPVVGIVRLNHPGTPLAAMADRTLPVFDASADLLREARKR